MTVKQLIQQLSKYPANLPVKIFNVYKLESSSVTIVRNEETFICIE